MTGRGALTAGDLDAVKDVLRALRTRLGMDLAHLSEIGSGQQTFHAVVGDGDGFGLHVGDHLDLHATYCGRMLEGEIDHLVTDASSEPAVAGLPVTHEAGIGAYIGVPVHLPDGTLFGTLCCLSHAPEEALSDRDVRYLRVVADILGSLIFRQPATQVADAELVARIDDVLSRRAIRPLYQPIVDLESAAVVGVEALARFEAELEQPPPAWFADAERAGRGLDLQLLAIERALEDARGLPDAVLLAINVSPAALASGEAEQILLRTANPARLAVEITEHAVIDDYDAMATCLAPLRRRGVRLAIDDVGAGFATMRHILRLSPDLVKLDMDLTREIGHNHSQDALVASLVAFTNRIGARLVAEGIETPEAVIALRAHGVSAGQGYHFARPSPLPTRDLVSLAAWVEQIAA